MIDQKIDMVTVHDVNPSHSEEIFETLNQLDKLEIKYSLSVVPYYSKKYNIKNDINFCNKLSSLLNATQGNVELTLHGLWTI